MIKKFFLGLLTLASTSLLINSQIITPGDLWIATDLKHINAHGGGIIYTEGRYYWFGESRPLKEDSDKTLYGVGCYSSDDLSSWKNEGLVLKVTNDTSSMLQSGCVIERPKVLYNKKTGKYVMWFHHELKGQGYKAALTGVAVADKVTGPYKWLGSLRPNAGKWPANFTDDMKTASENDKDLKPWSEEWKAAVRSGLFVRRDFDGGQMARDMTLFVDSDGKAWHIHSSEENMTLHFSELTDDFQDFTGVYYRVLPGDLNEAPALFKKGRSYYMFTSGTTGWNPNPARLSVSKNLTEGWKTMGNPCRGTDYENNTTFRSQSTFILRPHGTKKLIIFMGDRWNPRNLADSRHIWLPLEWEDGLPVLKWKEKWSLTDYK
jgi:beta-xylosidase